MEEKCYHFSNDTAEDGTIYCRKCSVILDKASYWTGDLTVGKMTTSYKAYTVGLDIKDLIEEHLGSAIDLNRVVICEGNYSWDHKYEIGFTIGRSQMFADISARKADEYTATDKYFEMPKVEEEVN